MAKRPSYDFVSESTRFTHSDRTKERYRLSPTDFTRNRKLPFEQLVLCMLKLLRRSLQLELDSFFKAPRPRKSSVFRGGFHTRLQLLGTQVQQSHSSYKSSNRMLTFALTMNPNSPK